VRARFHAARVNRVTLTEPLGPFRAIADIRAYETTPEPSTRSVVDITKDVRLKLQFLKSMLDYIADADDTG